jgi:7-cyano-7-deazaguanine reductase
MTRLGNTQAEAIDIVTDRAEEDLSELLETDVRVTIFSPDYVNDIKVEPYFNDYHTIETDTEMMDSLEFDKYTETPELLLEHKKNYGNVVTQKLHSSLLKSNCRVTNQPDWGDVYVHMESTSVLDYKDFAKYVVSYRDECHFHEEICETFYKRLWDLYRPERLAVTCLYARRGGIDINPTRVSNVNLLDNSLIDMELPFRKTPRQ